MRKLRLINNIALITVVIVIGCGSNKKNKLSGGLADTTVSKADTAGAVNGDWIIIREIADAQGLNPITQNDAAGQEIYGYMFESLNNVDPVTFADIPYLAYLPEISEDHLSYVYHLKKNITFSDGIPLTGEDIIFTVKAIKNPFADDAALRNYFESVRKVEIVNNDPYSVKFTMSQPYWRAIHSNGSFAVLAKHVLDPQGINDKISWEELSDYKLASKNSDIRKYADFLNTQEVTREPKYLVGTGPYKLKSWRTGQEIVLERNNNYWDKANTPSYANQIIFRTIQDNSASVVAIKNNEVDVMNVIVPQDFYANLDSPEKFHLLKAQPITPQYNYIGWNENNPIFADSKVRLALSYLVDRKDMINKIFYGDALPIQSHVFFRQVRYLNTDLPSIDYDPEKARKLLQDAGWKDSDGDGILDKTIGGIKVDFKFTFLIYPSPVRKQVLLVVIDAMKKVGIRAELQELEWSVYIDKTKKHEFDATMGGWALNITPPDPFQIWHSSQSEGEGSNFISFKNHESDSLIEAYRGEFDDTKRIEILKRWQKLIYDEQPYTFLWSPKARYVYSDRYRDTRWYNKQPSPNYNEWWVPKNLQKYTQSQTD